MGLLPNLLMTFQGWYRGFVCKKEKKIMWVCAMLSVLWSVWIERNNIIFYDLYLPEELIWEKLVHLLFGSLLLGFSQ